MTSHSKTAKTKAEMLVRKVKSLERRLQRQIIEKKGKPEAQRKKS